MVSNYSYKKSSKKYYLVLIFFVIIACGAYAAYTVFLTDTPSVEGTEAFETLPSHKTITLRGSNLKTLEIYIKQGNRNMELLKDSPSGVEKTYTLQIQPKTLEMTDGSATVLVKAGAGLFKKRTYEINALVDTVPPSLTVLSASRTIERGGTGVAILQAKAAETVHVALEERFFNAFASRKEKDAKTPGGTATYTALFPAPFDIGEGSVFYAVAQDTAGNRTIKALPTQVKMKKFKTSIINLEDSFLNKVISSLLNEMDLSDPEAAFRRVNEDMREKNMRRLVEIGRTSEPEILWQGPFSQMKNSKVMATYGDERTYLYGKKPISRSVHLGYDLASTANAAVEAANSGIVSFAGEFGIYGNMVLIDHGLGLMSLYGHLSHLFVKEGQKVRKGEIIARTGATGLAGGDHLHFGILLHGYDVSPLEWWDPHWVRVNIAEYLQKDTT